MTKSRWIGLAFGVVLLLAAFSLAAWQGVSAQEAGASVAQAAAAATPTTAPTAAPTAAPSTAPNSQTPPGPGPFAFKGLDLLNNFWNALASRLGITVDELKSKVVQAEQDAIDQAVKDGKLTQDQGNALKQKLNPNAPLAPFKPGLGRGRGNGLGLGRGAAPGLKGWFGLRLGGDLALGEAIAKAVNLSVADLVAQLRSGKTLADIAKAQNVDEATVKQAIIDTATAQVDRALQDGLISQAQATQFKSNLTPDKIDLSKWRGLGGWNHFLKLPQFN